MFAAWRRKQTESFLLKVIDSGALRKSWAIINEIGTHIK